MRFPKPARWALGILLVFAALKGGCEIVEEIVTHWPGHHGYSSPKLGLIHEVGRSSRAYTGEPAQKALSYLKDNADRLGLKPNLDDLKVTDARSNPFGDNVALQQVYNGWPVENARLQVNFDKDGYVIQLVSSYTSPVNALDRITLSKEQATNLARQEFSRTTPTYVPAVENPAVSRVAVHIDPKDIQVAESTKVEDVYFAHQNQLRRAYKTFIHATKPFGIKEIVTDANNGGVLQVRNFVFDAVDGRGQVLSNDAVPGATPTLFVTVSLPELVVPPSGPFLLKGPYVVLEDIEEPKTGVPRNDSAPEFMNSKDFADVMVYYHIDSMQRYIQAPPLEFKNIMNRQIRADAHGLGGEDDSRYVSSPEHPGEGYLAFGGGFVADAEDPDVIAHEYGHAIQDDQTSGKYTVDSAQTRAMGEGFADYWAFSVSSTHKTATDSSVNDPCCLMEWDHTTCLRTIDPFKFMDVHDFSPNNTAHENGKFWSATLVDIFTQLGKQTADRVILKSHFNVPFEPNFELGADSIITADWQLFHSANRSTLCTVFQRHNIYPANHCPIVSTP